MRCYEKTAGLTMLVVCKVQGVRPRGLTFVVVVALVGLEVEGQLLEVC